MSKHEKILEKILRGASDANVSFDALSVCYNDSAFKCAFAEVTTSFSKKGLRKS